MPANIAAVCNCIYLQPLPGIISPTFFGGLYYMNRTAERIDKIASVGNYYWYLFHAPLGRYILHGGDLIINNDGGNIYPQRNNPLFLLNEMNPCDHFNLGGTSNYSSLGWSTDTRLDHPERIGNNTWTGEYPAIDYMLYFNLWSMKTAYDGGISIPKYINLSHYYINSSTVPYWSGGYYNPTPIPLTASNSYKTQVDAYETVYMEKTKLPFYTNTNYIRAGKEIILKATSTMGDGGETYIKAGAVTWGVSDGTTSSISDAGIRFYIKKYDCAIENGNYDPTIDVSYSYKTISQGIPFNYGNNIAQNEDSTYNGTLRFSIKPHYIEYQKENIIGNIQSENTYHEAGAQDNTNSEFIQIIPNPADDEIAIIIPNDFRYDRIEITNIAGDCLEKIIQNSEQKIKLNISNYAAGIYFISLYSKEWLIYSQKLIKR